MKTDKIFRFLTLAFCALAFAFVTGCEGPEGPQGPKGDKGDTGDTGAQGEKGDKGDDGQQGVAGNQTCLECHTQVGMDAITDAYEMSVHYGAGAVAYAGGRGSCNQCHSDEGFDNFLQNTPGATLANVAYPTRVQCSTCHGNHTTLEEGLELPIKTEASVLAVTDGTTTFDFESASNLCANCHQSRRDGEYYDKYTEATTATRKFTGDDIAIYNSDATSAIGPNGTRTMNATNDTLTVVFDIPTDHVYISSTHAGPHHGPQANTIFGVGGYGSSTTNASHIESGCVSCHMGNPGETDGGHTFYPNVANCTECHESATDFDINGNVTDVTTRSAAIAAALEAIHAIHVEEGEVHPMYASIPRAEFKAFWNFMIIYEDKSDGAHNPGYVSTLLTVAETNLNLN